MKEKSKSRVYLVLGISVLLADAVLALHDLRGEQPGVANVLVCVLLAVLGAIYLIQAFVTLKQEQCAGVQRQEAKKEDTAEAEIRAAYPSDTEGMKLTRSFYMREAEHENLDIWYSFGGSKEQSHFFRLKDSAWIRTEYDELNAALLMLRSGVFDRILYSEVEPSDALVKRLRGYAQEHPERRKAVEQLKQKAFAELAEARVVPDFASLEELQKLRLVSLVSAQSRNLKRRFLQDPVRGVSFGELAYVTSLRFLYCIMLADIGKKRIKAGEKGYILLEPMQALNVDFTPYREMAEAVGNGFRIYVDGDRATQDRRIYDVFTGKALSFLVIPDHEKHNGTEKTAEQLYTWELRELE